MTFSDQDWDTRLVTLGDPAEKAFEAWCNKRGLGYVKYGLDRPPVRLAQVPPMVRYTPDYLTDEALYEVQGCGRDSVFKFKHDKLVSLHRWTDIWHTRMWLWHQPLDASVWLPIHSIIELCITKGELRTNGLFDGSKPFAAVPWAALMGQKG